MPDESRKHCGGFTYLAVLILIIIMGIMLGAVGQQWSAYMKREREDELLFRGKQIVDAIYMWYTPKQGMHAPTGLRELKDLLKDPRSLSTIRYLRRLYTDPITGEEWKVITGPVKGTAIVGIIGVASKSDAQPLRQKNIADLFALHKDPPASVGGKGNYVQDMTNMFKTFEGKKKYSEWQFVYGQAPISSGPPGTVPTGSGVPPWNPTNPSTPF